MKWNNKLSLGIIGTLALSFLPALALGDQNDDGKKEGRQEWKKTRHESQTTVQSQQRGGMDQRRFSQVRMNATAPTTNTRVAQRESSYQPSSRYQSNRTSEFSTQRSYARSGSSRDFWVPENVYRGWDRGGRHYYNHHYYGWNNGAWIILDSGYAPDYVGESIVARVQARLAQKGYYRGDIDGDAGPGTRSAIANYQADHDLRATGRINDSLLESLRLE